MWNSLEWWRVKESLGHWYMSYLIFISISMNSGYSGFVNGLKLRADLFKSEGLNVGRSKWVKIPGAGSARHHLSKNTCKMLKSMKIHQSYKDASVGSGKASSSCYWYLISITYHVTDTWKVSLVWYLKSISNMIHVGIWKEKLARNMREGTKVLFEESR